MPKIKCPHCGANNQDVTDKDRCWQCEKVLGDTPAVAAETIAPDAPAATPVQKQVEAAPPPPRKAASSPQRLSSATRIAIAVIVLLILLAIVFFVLKK
jgi:uncharacterized membrane protein YvbJ